MRDKQKKLRALEGRARYHRLLHTTANSLEFQGSTLSALRLRELAEGLRTLPPGSLR